MSQPIRTCVGCRSTDQRAHLQRYVVISGVVTPDLTKTAPGRGSWLHDDPTCWDRARQRGAFSRSFRTSVDASAVLVASEGSR